MDKIKPTEEQLNEKFITAHAECVEWWYVSDYMNITKFSYEFFIRFEREISWSILRGNKSITTEFAHKFEEQIGSKRWYLNGERHRKDGPAVIYPNGDETWCLNGELHRIGGPAIICTDGREEWYLNGIRHCFNGPAITYSNGFTEWWVIGKELSEEQFNKKTNKLRQIKNMYRKTILFLIKWFLPLGFLELLLRKTDFLMKDSVGKQIYWRLSDAKPPLKGAGILIRKE